MPIDMVIVSSNLSPSLNLIHSLDQQMLCLDEVETKNPDQNEVNSCESHCSLTIAGKVLDKDDLQIWLKSFYDLPSVGGVAKL